MAWLFLGAILGVVGTMIVVAAISALSRLREHGQQLPPIATPDGGVESSVERRAPVAERTSDG